jgi:predicted NAD-dependent protein-ADP-ribosyltransferase YbiA (DUF1768 family)
LNPLLSILRRPTDQIIRGRLLPPDDGAGILWSVEADEVLELSALGAIAWEGREDKPAGSLYNWTGFNLLCNAAPAEFELNGEYFYSIDSFAEALKFQEGTPDRGACAMAPVMEAKRLARRIRGKEFTYRDQTIAVGSSEHEAVLAAAISAKVAQHPDVQTALGETGRARLVFPLSYSRHPGALARVTPLALMIERWRLIHQP